MDEPMYTQRDEPQTEQEAVQRLRAELRRMTDLAEQLLDGEAPRKGRSRDDREAHDLWHEDAGQALRRAREALEQTSAFSLTTGDASNAEAHRGARQGASGGAWS